MVIAKTPGEDAFDGHRRYLDQDKIMDTYFEPYPTHLVFHEDYWICSHGTEDVDVQYINVEYVENES